MRLDLDTYKELVSTLSRNKSRSFLTGFGIFWGVFMLVGLIGGGKGMKEMLNKNFEGFATNSAVIIAQPTTKPFAGYRKGRVWEMNYNDIERLKAQIPELDVVSPMLTKWGKNASFGDKRVGCIFKGTLPNSALVEIPKLYYGRFLNDMDMQQRRKVCVIGKTIYKTLFPGGGNPCGQRIRVDSVYYDVVGVDYKSSNVSINGRSDESITIPLTLMQQTYNLGDRIDLIAITVSPGVRIKNIIPRIREVIGRVHKVNPKDEKSIFVVNAEEMFGMMDSLFEGVNFLILLVGIGTLLAGGIGVSNIMMVTVRERTVEIGIRRAIGATPRNILGQIISESLILTAVAGISGLLFAVVILNFLELANTSDGIVNAHFQIDFWAAFGAVFIMGILGVLAGIPPALRAMAIKPVDAMRDE